MTRPRLRPLLYLAGTVLFWGTSFAATRSAYESLSPMAVMWLRMTIASVAFLPVWRRLRRPSYERGDWRFLAITLAMIPCAYFTLEGYAMVFTTSAQAGVITAIAPLLVAAAAWLFLSERLSWESAVGIVVSIAAVAILTFGGRPQGTASSPMLGNLLEVGAMVAAAISAVTIKHLSKRYDPWFLTGLQAATGAVFFAPLALLTGPIVLADVTWQAWAAVAYLGVFPGLLAFGLYNSALALLPAARAAMAVNLIPAVALIAGWLWLGESLTLLQVGACVVLVGAVTFAEVAGRPRPVPTPPTIAPDDAPDVMSSR